MRKLMLAATVLAILVAAPAARAGILGTDLVRWGQNGGNVYYQHPMSRRDAWKIGIAPGEADLGMRHYLGRYGQSLYVHGGIVAGNAFDIYIQAGGEMFLSRHFQLGLGGYVRMNGGSNLVLTIGFSF